MKLVTYEDIYRILSSKEEYIIHTGEKVLRAHAVILATGGKAASVLGSDGSGYPLHVYPICLAGKHDLLRYVLPSISGPQNSVEHPETNSDPVGVLQNLRTRY